MSEDLQILVVQPPYPRQSAPAAAAACVDWMRLQLDELQPGAQDVVLLPEYATAPGMEEREQLLAFAQDQGQALLHHVAITAARLRCAVALAGPAATGSRWYNRTLLFGRDGRVVGHYDKVHLTQVEREGLGLTPGPTIAVCEYQGLRIGFATCFDLYFPGHFAALAARRADLVLCPSYQRSESAQRIRLICQARALDTGAYVVRSSYAMGSDGSVGGCSLVASPAGEVLADAGGATGLLRSALNPAARFVKPASHAQPPVEHRALLEAHRRPGLYRPACEAADRLRDTPFPRLCAHRGLSQACPENTLPAFAAAMALGVAEIELDVQWSRDRVPVICHDPSVERTTDGTGRVRDLDWSALRRLDAGAHLGPAWQGVGLPRLEEVLELAGGRVILNLHVYPLPELVCQVCDLLHRYYQVETAYLALGTEAALAAARDHAPEVCRACLVEQQDGDRMLAAAQRHACERVQFFRQVTAEQTRQAHALGLVCNLFWSDAPDDARAYVRQGIDVILTNAAHLLLAHGVAAGTRH